MVPFAVMETGFPAEGKGQSAEVYPLPGRICWDARKNFCVLSHYVERCHSRYVVTVNVGVFQDSRFSLFKVMKGI